MDFLNILNNLIGLAFQFCFLNTYCKPNVYQIVIDSLYRKLDSLCLNRNLNDGYIHCLDIKKNDSLKIERITNNNLYDFSIMMTHSRIFPSWTRDTNRVYNNNGKSKKMNKSYFNKFKSKYKVRFIRYSEVNSYKIPTMSFSNIIRYENYYYLIAIIKRKYECWIIRYLIQDNKIIIAEINIGLD